MRFAFIIVFVLGLLTVITYLYWARLMSFRDALREKKRTQAIRKEVELRKALATVDEWKKSKHEAWIKEYESINGRETHLDS